MAEKNILKNLKSYLEDPEISKYLRRKFFVKISRQAYTLLKYQVDFNKKMNNRRVKITMIIKI